MMGTPDMFKQITEPTRIFSWWWNPLPPTGMFSYWWTPQTCSAAYTYFYWQSANSPSNHENIPQAGLYSGRTRHWRTCSDHTHSHQWQCWRFSSVDYGLFWWVVTQWQFLHHQTYQCISPSITNQCRVAHACMDGDMECRVIKQMHAWVIADGDGRWLAAT